MTSIAIDAIDIINVLTQVRDRESLRLVERLVESQVTVLQSQLTQLEQVRGAVQEQIKTMEGKR